MFDEKHNVINTNSSSNFLMIVYSTHQLMEYILLKRITDILLSIFGIVILSPLLALTALSIKLYDGGPVIYKQVRLTKYGKEFKILKFRSMRVGAEKNGEARLCEGDDDDRVTPVGKILRKYWIDELPQLFNILLGEMSFVGPRPERPELAEKYEKSIPGFNKRLQVKAGLTGYAQTHGDYDIDPREKLVYDLHYINNMSIWMDCHIVLLTLVAIKNKSMTERFRFQRETNDDNHLVQ